MNKLYIIGIIIMLFCGVAVVYEKKFFEEVTEETSPKYSGPVPLGYDVEHFRETGITKMINNGGE